MVAAWVEDEEIYLKKLQSTCDALSKYFLRRFKHHRSIQGKFRLPAIVLSSVSGVASFGTTTFPKSVQKWVSVVVGGVNIIIAILNTVEAYMKIADMLAKALTAHVALKKLADDIQCEISIPVEDRQMNGIVFLRDSYARYQQIMDQAPPVEDTRLLSILDYVKQAKRFHMLRPTDSRIEDFNFPVPSFLRVGEPSPQSLSPTSLNSNPDAKINPDIPKKISCEF